MQQRRPRLGDILDDYCPRERRVTNHVIVAMIEDEVRQTRCSTCSADHDYKEAKVPAIRRAKPAGALFTDAPESATQLRPVAAAPPLPEPEALEAAPAVPAQAEPQPQSQPSALAADADPDAADVADAEQDDGPVHRRLIRATLPRPEGHVPERRAPEFTVRQPGAPGRGPDIDGNRPSRGPQRGQFGGGGGASRFGGGPRHGGGSGSGHGGQRHSGGRQGNGSGQSGPSGDPGQRQGSGRGRRRGGR
jgi:translation initiation factor IF-2